ncbi:MAG: hypothetical protein D6805_03985 [Planctomycetota bacterium]|nr:MAG: hypothetical protein D6805_03985 [Planctomycetota bacterium]
MKRRKRLRRTSRAQSRRSSRVSRVSYPPSKESMRQLLKRSGIKVPPAKLAKLWKFHQLFFQRQLVLDLSRIRNFENVVIKHYVDSLLVRQLISLPSPLLDIGTGAGFPGIPIKIFSPGLEIILAEKRSRRVRFLEEANRRLELGAQIYPHRVSSTYFGPPVRGVITRALESIDRTLGRVYAFLPRGGKAIFMKGPDSQGEVELACEKFSHRFRLIQNQFYSIPHTSHRRTLVVFERLVGEA